MKALSSTVGRKFVMALTGLFLCLFLVIHLLGNLLLYIGPEAYNQYAHKLHEQQEFLLLSQILLYTAFLIHIYLAFSLSTTNVGARLTSYRTRTTKRTDRLIAAFVAPEAWMFRSGAIVLLFLIIHVSDFKFEFGWDFPAALGWDTASASGIEPSRYDRASVILRDFWRAIIYTLGSLVLGVHVSHGMASAFQSLGLNHPKYNPWVKSTSVAVGWIVALGFASFPVFWSLQAMSPVHLPAPAPAPVEVAPLSDAQDVHP